MIALVTLNIEPGSPQQGWSACTQCCNLLPVFELIMPLFGHKLLGSCDLLRVFCDTLGKTEFDCCNSGKFESDKVGKIIIKTIPRYDLAG